MTEKKESTPTEEVINRLPVPQAASESSPLLEGDEPFYDRLWYIHQAQEHLLPVPAELEDADFDLMFFFVDTPGENLFASDLKIKIEEIHGPGSARLNARIGRLRRWLGDDFDEPKIINEYDVERRKAYHFNAEAARMLAVGEEPPLWPEETDLVSMIPGQEYPLAQEAPQPEVKREFDRIQYRWYTARYGMRENIESIPQDIDEGDYQLLSLLTKGRRTGTFISATQLNRELDKMLPGSSNVQLSSRISRLQEAFPELSRFVVREGRSYTLDVYEARFLQPDPASPEETTETPSILTVPTQVNLPVAYTESTALVSSKPDEPRRILFEERYPNLYTNIPRMIEDTVERLRGTEVTTEQISRVFGMGDSYIDTNIGKLIKRQRRVHGARARYSLTDVLMLRINREVRNQYERDLSLQEIRSVRRVIEEAIQKIETENQ